MESFTDEKNDAACLPCELPKVINNKSKTKTMYMAVPAWQEHKDYLANKSITLVSTIGLAKNTAVYRNWVYQKERYKSNQPEPPILKIKVEIIEEQDQ